MVTNHRLSAGLRRVLPQGSTLPLAAWEPRHRWIVRLLWAHVPVLFILSVLRGNGLAHSAIEVLPLAACAYGATKPWCGRAVRSTLAGLGLMMAAAVLVHLGGGRIEMHFHFFVMLPVISLYHDWRPFLMSIGFVSVHHGGLGLLRPELVFDHDMAMENPVLWAAVHAAFVLAASAVCVLSWRIIEDSNRAARVAMETSERRFRALVEHSSDVISVVDDAGVILYDSPSTSRIFGYAPSERVGWTFGDLIHPEDRPRVRDKLSRLTADAGGVVTGIELRVRHRDGSYRWVEAAVTNMLHDDAVGGLIGNFREITERKNLEGELSHQAFHDALTGLPNRALLLDRTQHALERRARGDAGVAMLFVDLDDFKTVNDGLGHGAGDEILRVTAQRIARSIRPGDTASRLGGDEFAVLLEEIADADRAYEIGARLLEAICMPIELEGALVAVHGSLGIAVSHEHNDAAGLLRNADLAMYRAKDAGKGKFAIYEDSMHDAVVERMALKADLRRAANANEFEPYYQPIVDLASGAVTGVEALLRWNHPTLGLVPPNSFIPLAEETGLIVTIGRQVLIRACIDTAQMTTELGTDAPDGVSVNISPRQIQHNDLVGDVHHALTVSGLEPHRLTLEVTENLLLEDTETVIATLAGLKNLGVRIALDDFGTGYSSLSYLDQFPVDVVKIDKSFIQSLDGPANAQSPLVHAIVNLGAVLGLDVTAEGIEETVQLDRLREMGCAHGQGYLFAKPMPQDQLREMLTASRTARLHTSSPPAEV